MNNRAILCFGGLALACSGAAWAQDADRCVEISPDGRQVINFCAGDREEAQGGIAGGAGVPFGTQPDWQNTLRRQVSALKLADMNGDGRLDLVVGCYISQSFPPYEAWRNLIYYNTGGQLEADPSWVSADQVHTTDLTIGDFNMDGYPDIFSANGGSAHSRSVIYWGGADGPSTSPGWISAEPQTTWALSCAAVDIDHDGDLDIITTNQTAINNDFWRPLYMFRNNNGVVETMPSWQSADIMISNGIDVGDFDNDGWEDLAVAKWSNFQSAIYRNVNGTPTSLPVWSNGITGGERGAAVADVDHDGWLDVVFGGGSSTYPTRLWRNSAAGDFTFTLEWTTAAPFPSVQELHWHDVNNDGWMDLAEVNFSTGRTHIYLNSSGALPTMPTWTYDAVPVGTALAFGDINGDGRDDLVIGYSGLPSLMVFYAQIPPCPGDVTGDGAVNFDDILAMLQVWGPAAGNPEDVNSDGTVDFDDVLEALMHWGACP